MDFSIQIRKEAQNDLLKSYSWYENQRTGLGEDFIAEVENALKYLRLNPEAFPKKKLNFREYTLKPFPYLIIYTIKENVVTIFAVFHTHLDPNKKP